MERTLLSLALGVLLNRRSWPFAALARRCGRSRQMLSWRIAQEPPTRNTIELVARGFGIPWGDVLEVMRDESARLEADGQSIGPPVYRDAAKAVITVEAS